MLVTCPHCTRTFPYRENKEYTESTILAEGGDDEQLILALRAKRGLNIKRLTIEAKDGYSAILENLKNIKINSGYINIKKLLVVADANSAGIQTRFTEIVKKLDKKDFSLPTTIGKLSNPVLGKKQCGIFLFPDNIKNGTIEDLCLNALTYPNKLQCIDEHITCIKNKNLFKTKSSELSKSRFHIYMSTSKNPTGNIGGATHSSDLDLQSQAFDKFVSFLSQLE